MTRWLLTSGIVLAVLLLVWLWGRRVLAVDWKLSRTFAEEKKASPTLADPVPLYVITQPADQRKQFKRVLRYPKRSA